MNDFKSYSAVFYARNDDIFHYGILGMKWGVRRFQNKDGTLTDEGRRRKKLSDSEAYKEYLSEKKSIDVRYGSAGLGVMGTGSAAGVMGGLAAGLAVGGGPAGVAAYAAVRIGAMIAALPALGLITHSGDKNIDNVVKSYGKERIEKMKKLCEQKAKHMSRNDIINMHNLLGRNPTKEEKDAFDKANLEQIEKDIIEGKLDINDLKKKQDEILKQNKAFYK